MSLPRHLFAPAFRTQRLGWFFTLLIGIMVYVATFAMAGEAALSAMTLTWDQGLENRMTVEIAPADDESASSQPERLKQALSILHAIPGLAAVTSVSEEDTMRLLEPWINQPDLLRIIPLPTLIDIERAPGNTISAGDIEARLKSAVPDAHVDDHGLWLADMRRLLHGLMLMGCVLIGLTIITLFLTVSLICRAVIVTEKDILSLLHLIGAEDRAIAVNFQFHAQKRASPAAWIGFVLALASLAVLLFFLRHIADPALLQPMHWAGLAALMLAVPLAAIWIAALSARLATLRLLQALP